jgi:uncharacterized integral membrane protein
VRPEEPVTAPAERQLEMAVLGIVLIVLAVLFGLGVSVSSTASTTLEVYGINFGVSVPTVFFLGAAVGAAVVLGVWLMKKGMGRSLRHRKEVRELRAQAAASDTAATDVTQGDAGADVPPALDSRDVPTDGRLATEQELAPDPGDTKQPQ